MRCKQFTKQDTHNFNQALDKYDQGAEVVNDEETEQVFSRKDRKAYRSEVLRKQRTEASARNTKRKASTLG